MHSESVLQVVTTNIGGNRHSRKVPLDPPQIAREVREILPIDPKQPLILAVQEASQVWYQENVPLDTSALLATELGSNFKAHYAVEVDSLTHPHRRAWNTITYEGAIRACEGNSIITNLPLTHWPWPVASHNHPGYGNLTPLSTVISEATLYSTGDRNTQPRGILVASLDSPFGPIFFMATHLTTFNNDKERLDPTRPSTLEASRERLFQAKQILRIVEQLRNAEEASPTKHRPIILAGDFNAQPSSPEIQTLCSVFKFLRPRSANGNLATHLKHQVQIDHIFLSDPTRILGDPSDCFIQQGDQIAYVTDHLPVVAMFSKSME